MPAATQWMMAENYSHASASFKLPQFGTATHNKAKAPLLHLQFQAAGVLAVALLLPGCCARAWRP